MEKLNTTFDSISYFLFHISTNVIPKRSKQYLCGGGTLPLAIYLRRWLVIEVYTPEVSLTQIDGEEVLIVFIEQKITPKLFSVKVLPSATHAEFADVFGFTCRLVDAMLGWLMVLVGWLMKILRKRLQKLLETENPITFDIFLLYLLSVLAKILMRNPV
uniref:Uncharacterized protein n=1 Tax=Glossina brevipalpis TaxID=37001 RepID=A0A1A9WU73_9MUSC